MKILRMADVARTRKGGVAGFMLESSEELTKEGHQVAQVFADSLAPGGIPVQLRRFIVPFMVVYRSLQTRIDGDRPDVVEIHEPSAAVYCFARKRFQLLGLPPAVVLSYGLEERSWAATRDRASRFGRRLPLKTRLSVTLTLLPQARYALRHAEQVLVPSTEDAEHLRGTLKVSPQRVKRINTGVTDAFGQVERRPATKVRRVLFVGSWIDRKGCSELVCAWTDLSATYPELRLTVAGAGTPASRVLGAFPPSTRPSVTVRVEVEQSELLDLLAEHDLFVLPSWFEGMPLALLEAAAAGLPCIAGGVCGTLDFFRPERAHLDGGILIEPHSSAKLASAIEDLVRHPDQATILGQRARRRAREFTWRATAEQAVIAYNAARE